MVRSYGRYTFLATCAILTLALSIDLTLFLSKVIATVSAWPEFWILSVAWYLVLRATDFLAELLPLACFIGVFSAEIVHTTSQERLLVWLSGRAAWQCVVPVLLFGAVVGLIELALTLYVRPLAVLTMAVDNLGSYGERFNPRPLPYPQWIAAGRDMIEAFVEPGSPPVLRDVRIYRLDEAFVLKTFYRAKLAKPVDDHSWTLSDGYRWDAPPAKDHAGARSDLTAPPISGQKAVFAQETIDLDAAPIWINTLKIGARYLGNDTFNALRKLNFSPDAELRTWEQARYSLPLLSAAMPLLATCLSIVLLANEISMAMLCVIALSGYAVDIAMKTFILLGEHGRLPPVIAGWTIPVLLLLICVGVVLARGEIEQVRSRFSRHSRRVRRSSA